jgi:acetoin:2,6-dichlorophenolindophenol oxidoreductase subunit alpha
VPLTAEELTGAYATMRLIREFEESIRRLHGEGKLPGFMHVSVGQEAVPVGVSLRLRRDDLITTTHRGHGDMIAKGAAVEGMIAEIYGRAGGLCRAKGGSMHVADLSVGALGANGIVAAGAPIAVGAALSLKRQGSDRVVVAYSGDGALANGAMHEAFNMASLWKVPVIFVRVNNRYAESTPIADYLGIPDPVAFAQGYGLAAELVDGNDVEAVADAAERAVARGRAGEGATFLEVATYRRYGHNIGDTGAARPSEEVEHWLSRDPIDLLHARLLEGGAGVEDLDTIDTAAAERMTLAIDAAAAMPEPPDEWAFEDVYSEPEIIASVGGGLL